MLEPHTLPITAAPDILEFEQGGYQFKELSSAAELTTAFAFRYAIVVEKMHWVPGDPATRQEYDEFDPVSYHFGAYRGRQLVGYMRFTREGQAVGTMTRNYFSELFTSAPAYPPDQTVDISRLLIDTAAINRNKRQMVMILRGLYRLAYGRSERLQPHIRYWYFVTTPILLRGLRWRFGFPVQELGHGVTSDGKTTYVAGLDLEAGRRRLRWLAPWRLHYFQSVHRHAQPRTHRTRG